MTEVILGSPYGFEPSFYGGEEVTFYGEGTTTVTLSVKMLQADMGADTRTLQADMGADTRTFQAEVGADMRVMTGEME